MQEEKNNAAIKRVKRLIQAIIGLTDQHQSWAKQWKSWNGTQLKEAYLND